MAGGNLSPRQKMIGMMYLVLTALLALNISKEIINAFVVINDSLEKTSETLSAKNGMVYNAFAMSMANDPVKTGPFNDKANKAKKYADDMFKYIDGLKAMVIANAEQIQPEIADTFQLVFVDKKDDYDTPTYFMIGEDPGNIKVTDKTGKAAELKAKIEEYKKKMLDLLDAKEKANFKMGMSTDKVYSVDQEKVISWEWYNFYHSPVAAVMANLSKIQADVKNVESDIINTLYKNISAMDFKFDDISAKVIAPTNYVLLGEEYKADIFVAASSKTQNPVVLIGEVDTLKGKLRGTGDSSNVKIRGGTGVYTVKPTSEGLQKYSGVIRVKKPDNTIEEYPFHSEYMVAKPAVVVSPTKMNVFYIGVDNPVDISVPGIPAENIVPSMSVRGGGGSISGGKGKYTVKVRGGTEALVSVSARTKDGNKSMGPPLKFRVKRVPDPVAKVVGKKGDDVITKGQLRTIPGVMADLENFDFDLKFRVTSFAISATLKGSIVEYKSNSNALSAEMKSLLQNIPVGSKVYFEQVRALGPDGTTRKIPGVNLKVK